MGVTRCRGCGASGSQISGRPRVWCDEPECQKKKLAALHARRAVSYKERPRDVGVAARTASGHRRCRHCWSPILSAREWQSVIGALNASGNDALATRIDQDMPLQQELL